MKLSDANNERIYVRQSVLGTALASEMGIEVPIFSAGMALAAGPELAAAVSNGGGCGVIGTAAIPVEEIGPRLARTRELTDRPFGANVILALLQEGQIEACFEQRVPLIVFFWGDPGPYVADAHRRGIRVFVQVGSVAEAAAAAETGVDGIIAQGVEAGGHVRSTTSLSVLLPAIAEAVKPVPVIAAGGIADGRGLVAALSLGAQAVSMGTRFLCSHEALVAPIYKQRVTQSAAEDTVLTGLFNLGWDAPHRVLRNQAITEWEAAGCPSEGERPGEGSVIGTSIPYGKAPIELYRYAANSMPASGFQGNIEYAAMYAGESCALVTDIKPAAQIVREIAEEAEAIIGTF